MHLLRLYVRTNRNAQAERVLSLLIDRSVALPAEELPALRRQMALAITAPEQPAGRVEEAQALLAKNRIKKGETTANRRVLLLVRGRLPQERSASLCALEQLPGGPAVTAAERLRLAQLYDANGDWQHARQQLLELLDGDANNAAYLAVLIDGLLRHGKKAEADDYLDRLSKIEPDSDRTRELRLRRSKPMKR